jgi:hypothetical protein
MAFPGWGQSESEREERKYLCNSKFALIISENEDLLARIFCCLLEKFCERLSAAQRGLIKNPCQKVSSERAAEIGSDKASESFLFGKTSEWKYERNLCLERLEDAKLAHFHH